MSEATYIEPMLADEPSPQPQPQFPQQQQQSRERKHFLANLAWDVTEFEVATFFSQYGKVESARIVTDNRGLSKGFGFVVMSDDASAAAVTKLAEENHNTITMCGRHSVHLAVHDKERARKKAAERRAVRDLRREQVLLSKMYSHPEANPMAHPYMPYHPGMMGQQPAAAAAPYQFSGPTVPSAQQQSQQPPPPPSQPQPQTQSQIRPPQPSSFASQKMKVSVAGNGGAPFEILVENIDKSMTLDQLVASFSSYGEIVGASLRVSFGALSGGGRPSYGRVRFSNHQSLAAAVLGRGTTPPAQPSASVAAPPMNRPQPQPQLQPQQPAATYGLWRPKTAPSSAPAAPTSTPATQSVEGTLSSWSGSLGGAFTPTRNLHNNHVPPGF